MTGLLSGGLSSSGFEGELFEPGDEAWELACQPWNLVAEQHPAMVARPATSTGVAKVLEYARKHGLSVAPQSTGHGAVGLPALENTILLRTGLLNGVSVDPLVRTARVGAGVIWRDVVNAAAEHGLVAMHGSAPTTGVAGYMLGGGIGWLGRREGLAANHVRSFEVVTAAGEAVHVDAEHEPDLFWALRGGGGGQVVVTEIEIELFPLAEVFAGSLFWPIEQAPAALHCYRQWTATLPESVTSTVKLARFPPLPLVPEPLRGKEFVVITLAATTSEPEARELVRPLAAIGTPMIDTLALVPGAALADIAGDPPGPVPGLGNGLLVSEFTDGVVDRLLELGGPGVQTPLLMLQLRHLGGAMRRAPQDAGAGGALDADALVWGVGMAPVPPLAQAVGGALRTMHERLSEFAASRSMLAFTEIDRSLRNCFPEAIAQRLGSIRKAYDPDGLIAANYSS